MLRNDTSALTVPPLSRRAESLGTENAFVVLAEVNALVRAGPGHRLVLHRPARLPDAARTSRKRRSPRSAAGKHGYTPSAGIDELRAAAAQDIGARRGLEIRARGRRRRRGREAVHRLHDRVGHRSRRRRRGDLSRCPGFPIYESQIVANGAVPVPIYLRESRNFAFDPAELEAKITPKTRLLILNTPHNPTGGILRAADLDAIADDPRPPSAGVGVRRRDLLAARLRRRVRFDRDAGRGCWSARSSATARRRPGR